MSTGRLSIEEQRQLIYSSLLRYTSETASLRERVLGRFVMGGLVGSSVEEPFRVGKIVENLRLGQNALTVRTETVQETLTHLIAEGKAEHSTLGKRHVYYLTEKAHAELAPVVSSADADFSAAIERMLKDTGHLVDSDTAIKICRRFVLECFARFGRVLAKTVTGQARPDEVPRVMDTRDAFKAAVEQYRLSPEALESLSARCNAFLKSSDHRDQKVKFHLTQSYYFAELLGFENSAFNPLQDHAFSDAILYLDTNVIIAGVLPVKEQPTLFDELITITKRLGIELRVTRATINEARHVARVRLPQIEKMMRLPPTILEHTDDQFVIAFLNARDKDPNLSPAEFLRPFESLADTLTHRWNISLEDRAEDEVLAATNGAPDVCRLIDEEAQNIRGWGKSQAVQHMMPVIMNW